MKNKFSLDPIAVILPAAAAVLNGTSNVVLIRYGMEWGAHYDHASGFSMIPVGYGVWGAVLAGICAIILTVLGIINCVKSSVRLRKWMFGISALALLMILSLLISGSMTLTSFIIAVLLAVETLLLYYNRNST